MGDTPETMADHLHAQIVHQLRTQGWSREDAIYEADERIGRNDAKRRAPPMADPAVKLTKPQWLLLVDIETDGRFSCSDTYPPAKKLTELGFVEKHTGKFGGTWFTLTDKGLALLDALKEEGEGRHGA